MLNPDKTACAVKFAAARQGPDFNLDRARDGSGGARELTRPTRFSRRAGIAVAVTVL
jgi:hypothetical protein